MTPEQADLALAGLVLAIIPPAGAILVELINPIGEKVISASVEKDLGRYGKVSRDAMLSDASKMVEGAVELAGLAPTFVATITSAFTVLYESNRSFLLLVAYFCVMGAIALWLFREIGGQTFLQLAEARLSRFNLLGIEVIRRVILFLNAFFIIIALYLKWDLIVHEAQAVLKY